jgi:hypothetical protein
MVAASAFVLEDRLLQNKTQKVHSSNNRGAPHRTSGKYNNPRGMILINTYFALLEHIYLVFYGQRSPGLWNRTEHYSSTCPTFLEQTNATAWPSRRRLSRKSASHFKRYMALPGRAIYRLKWLKWWEGLPNPSNCFFAPPIIYARERRTVILTFWLVQEQVCHS